MLALLLWLPVCSGLAAAADTPVVTLMTHDSFALSEGLLKSFERQQQATLAILKSGDAGAALNQAILSRANPMADVFFGVDNTFLSRALAAGIFEPYASPQLERIPAALQLDPQHRLLPVDFGDVCLNYDRDWFARQGLQPPRDLADLLKPELRGLTVVQHPATSSPGMAFLLTTVGRFGEAGYLDFWRALRANDVYVANGWSEAYFGQFSRAKGGTRPIVVSYASSPAAEVHFSKSVHELSPTAAVLAPHAAFRQIEFVGVLKGTRQPVLARKLVDFILGAAFQQEIPLQMWVFPADPAAPLPEVFRQHARTAEAPVNLSPAAIEAGRETWLNAWTDTVLR
jgi:thiamine transport system substrate-binding protein